MRDAGFTLKYLILLIIQILICVFLNISQYLVLCILPVMILCMPLRHGAVYTMIVAFISGFVIDYLSGGILGLISLALVPVAFIRHFILRLSFGHELYSRGENLSFSKVSIVKMFLDILLVNLVFSIIYIWVDAAGMRPFWFNAAKIGISSTASTIVSLIIANILCPDNNSKWM